MSTSVPQVSRFAYEPIHRVPFLFNIASSTFGPEATTSFRRSA